MCSGHDSTDPDAGSADEVNRDVTRRGFLRTAAVGAAAMGMSGALTAPAAAKDSRDGRPHRIPPDRISIQLYTLRDQLAIDFEGTLARLAKIGYRRVEHAGFLGRTVTEFKAALDALGIWASSGHVGIPQPFDAAA